MLEWIKEKILTIKENFTDFLIVTHPLRTILFFCLVGPLLIPIGFGGLFGLVYCLYTPFALLSSISIPNVESLPTIAKSFFLWILGIAIAATSAFMGLYGLFIYVAEIYNSIYLMFVGKITKGIILDTWNTSTRSGNSTTHSLNSKISFVPEGYEKSIVLSGASQRSSLQELVEIEITKGKEVLVVYDPKNPYRARMKHKDISP